MRELEARCRRSAHAQANAVVTETARTSRARGFRGGYNQSFASLRERQQARLVQRVGERHLIDVATLVVDHDQVALVVGVPNGPDV